MIERLMAEVAQQLAPALGRIAGDDSLSRGAEWIMAAERRVVNTLGRAAQQHEMAVRLAARARITARLSPDYASIDPLEGLEAGNGALAAAAREHRAAETRRLGAFGDPVLYLADLDAADRRAMIWAVAACARPDGTEESRRTYDTRVAAAVAAHLEDGSSPASGLVATAERVAALHADPEARLWLGIESLAWGRLTLAAACLSGLAGVRTGDALELLLRGSPEHLAMLARAACGDDAGSAAGLLLTLARGREGEDHAAERLAERLLAAFAALPIDRAREEAHECGLDPGYRRAIRGLARP